MSEYDFTVRIADWSDPADRAAIRRVRETVFIAEQGVPPEEEWDAHDETCLHVLALDATGEAIGTGRLLSGGWIGRLAVVRSWRGRGVGDALMRELLAAAYERGEHESLLHAQTHAIPFYERFGYVAEGEEFEECGIPHRLMRLRLGPQMRPSGSFAEPPRQEQQRLRTVAQNRDAALTVARAARRDIAIFSYDLEPELYDTPEFAAELKRLALSSRFARIRILVQDPARAVKEGHRLVTLAQYLSSFVKIRVPNPDDHNLVEAFLLADEQAALYRTVHDRWEAVLETGGSRLARLKLRLFDGLWLRSDEHPDLRRMII